MKKFAMILVLYIIMISLSVGVVLVEGTCVKNSDGKCFIYGTSDECPCESAVLPGDLKSIPSNTQNQDSNHDATNAQTNQLDQDDINLVKEYLSLQNEINTETNEDNKYNLNEDLNTVLAKLKQKNINPNDPKYIEAANKQSENPSKNTNPSTSGTSNSKGSTGDSKIVQKVNDVFNIPKADNKLRDYANNIRKEKSLTKRNEQIGEMIKDLEKQIEGSTDDKLKEKLGKEIIDLNAKKQKNTDDLTKARAYISDYKDTYLALEVTRERRIQFSDYVSAILSPSRGQQQVSTWLQKQLNVPDITKINEEGWGWHILDPVNAINDAFCKSIINKDSSDYFVQTSPGRYSSGEWPAISMADTKYIYAKKAKYVDNKGTPLYTFPNNKCPGCFPEKDGTPKGYLYTISWSFNHKFSQQEIEDMTPSERMSNNAGKESGKMYYTIVLVDNNNKMTEGVRREVPPGGNAKNTVSLYVPNDIKNVCIKILGFDDGTDYYYYPEDCKTSGKIGTVKEIDVSVQGNIVSPSDYIDPSAAQYDSGTGVPITSGDGVKDSGSGSSQGDYGGRI
jgi:hypothetical protein